MTDPIQQAIIGLVAGVVFGLYGVVTKKPPDEAFSPKKLVRTAVIYGAAGIVVATGGDAITQENITAATGFTVVLGEIVDKLWSRAVRNTDLNW